MIVRKRSSEVRQPHFLLLFGTELPLPLQGIFIAVATDAGRLVSTPVSVFFLLHPVFFRSRDGFASCIIGGISVPFYIYQRHLCSQILLHFSLSFRWHCFLVYL